MLVAHQIAFYVTSIISTPNDRMVDVSLKYRKELGLRLPTVNITVSLVCQWDLRFMGFSVEPHLKSRDDHIVYDIIALFDMSCRVQRWLNVSSVAVQHYFVTYGQIHTHVLTQALKSVLVVSHRSWNNLRFSFPTDNDGIIIRRQNIM